MEKPTDLFWLGATLALIIIAGFAGIALLAYADGVNRSTTTVRYVDTVEAP